MYQLPFKPATGEEFFRVSTTLEGVDYLFDVRWNARDASWYMDLYTTDEVAIRRGIKIVLGAFLGVRSAHPLWPRGVFVARDSSGLGDEAGLADLGDRVQVYFLPTDEMQTAIDSIE